MTDLAEKVFLNRKVPGWLYQVDRGATTIWERWDAIGEDGTIYEPSMNSYNHYAYGAVCQWLFEEVAGVAPTDDGPGLRPGDARARRSCRDWATCRMWHDCRHGRIEAAWRIEGDRVTYTVTLPEGCQGVMPPACYATSRWTARRPRCRRTGSSSAPARTSLPSI